MKKVENQDRRFGSASAYKHFRSRGVDYLATPHEVETMRARAEKNPEDLPRLPWWRRLLGL
jgi:hypothetical protein